jgi:serine/threonine-protein kinase HipA
MELSVFLFNNKIGELYEINNQIYFKYDKKFLTKNIEISPLKLPLSIGIKPFINLDYIEYYNYLPGVFFDSLPDKFGTKAIEKYYEQKGINPKSLTQLQKLAFIGKQGMGALEYVPSVFNEETNEILEIKSLYKQTKSIIQNNPNDFTSEWIKHASSFASAGGARPKVLISWNQEKNLIKSKDCNEKGFEEWLLKFDERVSNPDNYYGFMQLEYLYMSMAKEVGINVPEIELIYTNDNLIHYAIKRFDRKKGKKFHLHTLASMEHINFNLPAHYSYSNALKLTDFLTNDFEQVKELFKRMIFNIIGRNQDDHAKNFSFVMDENGLWSLSPAYDITYAYGSGYTKAHQMTINGKTSDITLKDIYNIAEAFDIPKKEVNLIIESIGDKFLEFKKRALDLEINKKFINEINKNIRWYILKSIKG